MGQLSLLQNLPLIYVVANGYDRGGGLSNCDSNVAEQASPHHVSLALQIRELSNWRQQTSRQSQQKRSGMRID